MEHAAPKSKRKSPAAHPHELGRQGGKFLPGGHGFTDRGSTASTWPCDLGKPAGACKGDSKGPSKKE